MTVIDAFETFKSELELPNWKQQEVAKAQQDMREGIKRFLYVEHSFLTGSYARHTKIFPLNDVDVFVVRNAHKSGLTSSGGVMPEAALDQLVDAVRRAFPLTSTVEKQNRSVNVRIAGQDFGFDLTPAWLRTPDGYWIPDRAKGNWIPSDPELHAAKMTRENELNGGKLKPLIKMVKHWSRNNHDLLCSFHIELICADIFRTQAIDNYPVGMATVLVRLLNYVGVPMYDPIYGQSRVDKEISQDDLENLRFRIKNDAQRAIDSLTLQKNVGEHAAIEKWKQVFISGFPNPKAVATF